MIRKLVILGAGGHAKVAVDIALSMQRWTNIMLLDDQTDLMGTTVLGQPVVAPIKEYLNYHDNQTDFFVSLGDNQLRKKWTEALKEHDVKITTLIHPKAVINRDVSIEEGSIVMAGAVINSGTVIEQGVIVNTSVSVDHDCHIGSFVHLSPGVHLGGTVKVGDLSWLGIGTTVIQQVTIASKVIIGAGALVIKDVLESGVYVGSPINKKLK